MESIFDVLGVSQDASLREIKKAYASRLKSCDQHAEMERFQQLREAYEAACRWVAYRERDAPAHGRATEPVPDCIAEEASFGITDVGVEIPQQEVPAIVSPAEKAIAALAEEYARHPAISPAETLKRISGADDLIALEEQERFEQLLLSWLFEPELKIDWLDQAADMFLWDTANQHLFAWRYDLAWRMKRHLELRHSILAVKDDTEAIASGQYYYQLNAQRSLTRGVSEFELPYSPMKNLASALYRLEALYPREVAERFAQELPHWKAWIAKIVGSSELGRVEEGNKEENSFRVPPLVVVAVLVFMIRTLSSSFSQPSPSFRLSEPLPAPTTRSVKEPTKGDMCPYTEAQLERMMKVRLSDGSLISEQCLNRWIEILNSKNSGNRR